MKFSTIFATTALIAGALAAPSPVDKSARRASRVAARIARRSGGGPKSAINGNSHTTTHANSSSSSDVEYSTNWSGAVLTSPPSGETFSTVVGTFTVPTPSVPSSSSSTGTASVSQSFGSKGAPFRRSPKGSHGSDGGNGSGSGNPGNSGSSSGSGDSGYGSGSGDSGSSTGSGDSGYGSGTGSSGYGSGSGSSGYGSGSSGYGSGYGSSDSYSASAWVGIDGDTAANSILQAGVDFTVDSSGTASFDCWYEWYPNAATDFSSSDISFSEGDVVTVTIAATSSTEGTVTIENTTTGDKVSQDLTAPDSSSALEGQNAEWIVEDYESGSSLVSLVNFGTVVFTDASATTDQGTSVGLTDAQILDIQQDETVLTSVTIDSDSQLTVTYSG